MIIICRFSISIINMKRKAFFKHQISSEGRSLVTIELQAFGA